MASILGVVSAVRPSSIGMVDSGSRCLEAMAQSAPQSLFVSRRAAC